MKSLEHQSTGDSNKFYTGLNNPHNWCYANSTLQSLLASPDFGKMLANSEWVTKYKAPRKQDEKIDHPQLMIRIISNLFHWMNSGKFQIMKAQTLMVRYGMTRNKYKADSTTGLLAASLRTESEY